MSIRDHLLSRGVDTTSINVYLNEIEGIATFPIWNMSGQLAGYQQYNPARAKSLHIEGVTCKSELKYFTYAGLEGDPLRRKGKKKLLVWGLEYLELSTATIFITEGIFDAIKILNAGFPCIAVLSNDPHYLKSFFMALNRPLIAILDKGKAGAKLAKYGNKAHTIPEEFGDLGEMSQGEVNKFLGGLGYIS